MFVLEFILTSAEWGAKATVSVRSHHIAQRARLAHTHNCFTASDSWRIAVRDGKYVITFNNINIYIYLILID